MFAAHAMCGALAPTPNGQFEATALGTSSYIVPANVFEMSFIGTQSGEGGGGRYGGKGGNTRYKNNVPVVPGETLTFFRSAGGASASGATTSAGSDGVHSYVARGATIIFSTEWPIGTGPNTCDGGGDGGLGGSGDSVSSPYGSLYNGGGGGGAGGYAGPGGVGAATASSGSGTGGAAGGGGSTEAAANYLASSDRYYGNRGGQGGGVSLKGQGANGVGKAQVDPASDGNNGSYDGIKAYGQGGAAGYTRSDGSSAAGSQGGEGGVRGIHGENRFFPSTNTGDM